MWELKPAVMADLRLIKGAHMKLARPREGNGSHFGSELGAMRGRLRSLAIFGLAPGPHT